MNYLKINKRVKFYYIKVNYLIALFTVTCYLFIISQYVNNTPRKNYVIFDEKQYPHQLIDLNNFRFLINSQNVCEECKGQILLVILIHSDIANIDRRTAIRETWGKQSECLKILYFMGASNDINETLTIAEENEQYHDIIQGNFIDAYHNLTYKHVMVLKWATNYCPNAKYIVKMDDDLIVNTKLLNDNLKKGNWSDKNFIGCMVISAGPVLRDGKWGVKKEDFPETTYPVYCSGPFIIYSTDMVRRLLEESYKARYFWIDDVHVTGTLAKRIGFKNHTEIVDWYFFDIDVLYKKGPTHVKPFIYGPLNINPPTVYQIWKILKGENKTM